MVQSINIQQKVSISIYDFDEFSLFLLNILYNLPEDAKIRWSTSGKGLHIETNSNLTRYECQNRVRWVNYYGRLTFIRKNDRMSTIWLKKRAFINQYRNILISYSVKRFSKLGKKTKALREAEKTIASQRESLRKVRAVNRMRTKVREELIRQGWTAPQS